MASGGGGEFCALCEVEAAAWRCAECTLPLCDGCREQTHSAGDADTAGHTLSLVGDGSEMMAQMERRAEAEALRASEAAAAAQVAAAAPAPLLSEAGGLWLNRAGEIAARLDVLPDAEASGAQGTVAASLRVAPTVARAHDGAHGDALGAWAAVASPRLQDGGAPVLVLDTAQSFALRLAAVVYFCVEEPSQAEAHQSVQASQPTLDMPVTPDPARRRAPAGAAISDTAASAATAGIAGLSLAGMEDDESTAAAADESDSDGGAITGATPRTQALLRQRRPLGPGEAMLHIVLLEMEWDRSLTLR